MKNPVHPFILKILIQTMLGRKDGYGQGFLYTMLKNANRG